MLEPITASYLPRHHLENVVPSEQLQGYTCEWNFAGIAFIRPGSGERERCTVLGAAAATRASSRSGPLAPDCILYRTRP